MQGMDRQQRCRQQRLRPAAPRAADRSRCQRCGTRTEQRRGQKGYPLTDTADAKGQRKDCRPSHALDVRRAGLSRARGLADAQRACAQEVLRRLLIPGLVEVHRVVKCDDAQPDVNGNSEHRRDQRQTNCVPQRAALPSLSRAAGRKACSPEQKHGQQQPSDFDHPRFEPQLLASGGSNRPADAAPWRLSIETSVHKWRLIPRSDRRRNAGGSWRPRTTSPVVRR